MSRHMLISVIIPCYNLGEYIHSCIESIINQQDDDIEYVFVDDGSIDETGAILDLFCKNALNARVIHQTNKGVSGARNTALDSLTGEYVYLLDGDDILTKDAVCSMKKAIAYSPDLIMSPVAVFKDGTINELPISIGSGVYEPKEFYKKIKVFPTMPQLLYKREIIEKYNLRFDTSISVGEVYEFTIRFLARARTIQVISDVLFYYVMRYSSATHRPNFSKDRTVVDTLEKYYLEGAKFAKFPSFNTTAFKMLMSFTYNKYAKLHLKGKEVKETLDSLLERPIVKNCVNSVAKCSDTPIRERFLAIYVKHTGVHGYKLLTKLI